MSKKESVQQNVTPQPIDEHDHSHPMLPLMLVGVLAVALIAVLLKAFGVF